jgi:hypothetical protein
MTWATRLGAAAGVWLVLTAGAYVLGNQPRPGLIALVVATASALLWLLVDVTADSEAVTWRSPRDRPVRPPGEDPRLALLHRVVAQHVDAREVGDTLHRTLVRLADERLVARHGISLRTDPERAAPLVGPDVMRVVAETSAGPPYPRLTLDQIDRVVSRIEDL